MAVVTVIGGVIFDMNNYDPIYQIGFLSSMPEILMAVVTVIGGVIFDMNN